MNQLIDILRNAQENKAQEVLFAPGTVPLFRRGAELVDMRKQTLSQNELKAYLSELLSESEKNELFEKKSINGFKAIENINFEFSFHLDLEGVRGAISLQSQKISYAEIWNFNKQVVDSFSKRSGLILVAGQRKSGKSILIQQLLDEKVFQRPIAHFVDQGQTELLPEATSALFSAESLKSVFDVPDMYDVVVIDSKHPNHTDVALSLAEEGRLVIKTLPVGGLEQGIYRFIEGSNSAETITRRRLAAQLHMALGLYFLTGVEKNYVGAAEIIFSSSDVREYIRTSTSTLDFADLIRAQAERTGAQGLNQSLLSLLLKRKIDWRTAFEFSPDPEELDQLLKKIGI